MSTLKDFRESYYEFSGKASDVARTLALSGLAIIWIYNKVDKDGNTYIPEVFFLPAALLVLALAFDLLQYVVASLVWGQFHRSMEKRGKTDDDELAAEPWRNYPQTMFFILKLIAVAAAYFLLLQFFWYQLFR